MMNENHKPPDSSVGKQIILRMVLLCCLLRPSQSATVSEVTPRVGSLGGETRLTIYGSGFSADQFSQDDDENTGNRVYLVSSSGSRLQCAVHKDGCTEIQIMCYTPQHMNEEDYYIRVVVDGVTVPDSFLCNGDPFGNRCTYKPRDDNTPLLRSISPRSATPGSFVTMTGRIFTDRFGSNIATASNGRTEKLLRTYVGPTDCSLKDGDDFYGLSVDSDSDDGTLKCKLTGSSVGYYNASIITEAPYGRSKIKHEELRVSINDDIYTIQLYTSVTSISPQTGSLTGGMSLTIYGDYLDDREPYTQPRAYVGDTVCVITNVTIDEYIVCTVAADPNYNNAKFPGNRGVTMETWTSSMDMSTIDDILSLTPSDPGYQLGWLDETYMYDSSQTTDYVTKLSTFFTPPHSGQYMFQLYGGDGAKLYVDSQEVVRTQNSWGYTSRMDLNKNTRYFLEILHYQGSGDAQIDLRIKHFNTTFTNSWTGMAIQEYQKIAITSTVVYDVQELSFTGFTSQTHVKEVQQVVVNGQVDFRLGLNGVFTEPLTADADDTLVEEALNKLPIFSSEESVTVVKELTTTPTFTVTFESKRGDMPAIVVMSVDRSYTGEASEVTKGTPDMDTLALSLAGVISDPFSLTDLTLNKLSTVIDKLFEGKCPDLFKSPALSKKFQDFESNDGSFSGSITKASEPFCGRYSLKNPWKIYKTLEDDLGINLYSYRKACFAYRGVLRNVITFKFSYKDASTDETETKYKSYSHEFQSDSDTMSSTWYYTCVDMYDHIIATRPDDTEHRLEEIIISKGTDEDIYVDALFIGRDVTTEHADAQLLRRPPSLPNGAIIGDVSVSAGTDGSYAVTMKPLECGYDLPLFQLANGQVTSSRSASSTNRLKNGGSGTMNVVRTDFASPPVTGFMDISFNGNTKRNVNISLETLAFTKELQSLEGVGFVDIRHEGDCANFERFITFLTLAGDQPQLEVTSDKLEGIDAQASVTTLEHGGLVYSPLTGDMLQTVHDTPQVRLYINEIPVKCPGDCGFTWDPTINTNITAINPVSGTDALGTILTISGTGFSGTPSDNTVTIGNIDCPVTTATTTSLQCTVGNGPVGQHEVIVMVAGKGLASGSVMFEYTAGISSISPTSSGLGGGLTLTLTGYGFKDIAVVTIDSTECPLISVQVDQITCNLPIATAAGSYDVLVSQGTTNLTQPSFTYSEGQTVRISSLSQTTVPVAGVTLTLTGTQFGTNTGQVTLGGGSVEVTSWSDSQIVVETGPLLAGDNAVHVITDNGLAITSTGSVPELDVNLKVTNVFPLSGSVQGGTSLTIVGSGFGDNVTMATVIVGETDCDVDSITDAQIICTLQEAAKINYVDNSGIDYAFGEFYAFNNPNITIEVGQYVDWSWETPDFVNNVAHKIVQIPDISSTTPLTGGFDSGQKTSTGRYRYQFTQVGIYYAWSGFVDEWNIKNYAMTINVVEASSSVGEVSVSIMGTEALHQVPAVEESLPDISSCGSITSAITGCTDVKPTGSDLDKFNFVFWTCSTPVLTSVDRQNGTTATDITISGEGFSATPCQNEVLYGSQRCVTSSSSNTEIVCSIENTGTPELGIYHPITVRVNNRGYAAPQTASLQDRSLAVLPNIQGISPSRGSMAGGTQLTITGFGFGESQLVYVDGYTCTVVSFTYSEIICETPSSQSQSEVNVQVTVMVNGAPLAAACETPTRKCTFSYAALYTPTISAVTPTTMNGPATLNITGINLGTTVGDIEVTVGGVMATVTSVADTVVIATVQNLPAGTNGLILKHISQGLASSSGLEVTGEAVINTVTPSSGSIYGETLLSIQGNGFKPNDTTVLIDGTYCSIVTTTLNEVTCLTAAHVAGSVDISVTSNSQSYSPETFMYATSVTPTLTALDPQMALAGTTLTIDGTSLGDMSSTSVVLDDVVCAVTLATATQIKCTLGDHATGSVHVSVHVEGKGASNTLSFEYQLSLSSISPGTGGIAGGQTVTLQGTGFSSSAVITICGESCSLTGNTTTSLECRTPANTAQTCDVSVTVSGLTRTLTNVYTYDASLTPSLTSVSPRRGGTGGGLTLTITGSGFGTNSADVSVQIAGSDCVVVTVTDTEIMCTTGARTGAVSTTVEVQVAGNGIAQEVSSGDAAFLYVDVWSSAYTWGGNVPPQAGELIVIPAGQIILLDTDTPVLKLLLIQGGQLIFDEKDIELRAEIILITDGGLLQVGTEAEPFQHKGIITLYGHHRSKELPIYGTKVLANRNGTLDLHGIEVPLTWTRLASTSEAGSTSLALVDPVEWNVGDEIVIASTGHKHSQSENEKKTITAISSDKRTLTLDSALAARHVGEQETFDGTLVEFRGEVGLLTHNVVVRGNTDPQWEEKIEACPAAFNTGEFAVQTCFLGRFGEEIGSSQFGGQIIIHAAEKDTQEALARISFVEVTFGGQAFRLGRYPIHFHLNGNMSMSYVRGCGIHHTFNRAVNVHGSHNTMIERNVIYNIMGGAFFLEDGIETGNTFQYNLAVFVRESSSLLNDDVTPASFWVTNPNNIVQHNAAAGGSHFGFWYRMHTHPDGPSFTSSVCCKNEPLGVFNNNSAHSFGWFGLWIFEDYFPLTGGCGGSSVEPALFIDTFVWNNEKGIEFVNAGALQVVRLIAVQNKLAGFEGKKVIGVPRFTDDSPMVKDSLIVGRTTVIPDSQQGCTNAAVVFPHGFGFRLKNVRFVNFDASCEVFGWASIAGTCSLYCGGFSYHTEGLSFINSPNKGRYSWEWEGVIVDRDGTATGKSEPYWKIVPTSDTLPPECEPAAEYSRGFPASLCPPQYEFHRFSFNEPTPKALEGKDVLITNQYGNGTAPFAKKRITHPMGWMCLLIDGEYYNIEFINAEHLTNISYNGAFYEFEANDYIGLKLRVTKLPDRFTIDGGNTFRNASVTIDPSSARHGDWTWDPVENEVTFIIGGSGRSKRSASTDIDRPVQYSSYKCYYTDCIPPPDPDTVPPGPRPLDILYWNDTNLWNDTGDGYITSSKNSNSSLPGDGDNVKILFDDWVVVANASLLRYRFGTIMLEGALELLDIPGEEYELNAEFIIIMGGRLVVGWPDDHFHGLANIILRGNHSSPVYPPLSDGPSVGAKVISVFGGLDLFGKDVGTVWTRLDSTVMPGSNQIDLTEPVGWSVGNEIVVTSTSFNAWETEVFSITAISSDNMTLTLNASAQFRHIAHQETIDGQQMELRAGVGLLTRNIRVIGEDYDGWYDESFGARVLVGLAVVKKQSYTGYARLSNVEFYHTGQEGWTEEYDPRFSVAFVATGTVSDVKPSVVHKCAFSNGFNTAVGAFGIGGLNITHNVVYNSVGNALRTSSDDSRITNNLVSLSVWTGAYQDRKETFNFRWESGVEGMKAKRLVLQDNLVTGSERMAYHVAPLSCSEPSPTDWYNNNEAHSSLIGVGVLPIDEISGSCAMLSGFTTWKNYFFGVYYQHSAEFELKDVVMAENGLGVYSMVVGPSATGHQKQDKKIKISDCIIIGATSSFDCTLDASYSNDNTDLSLGQPPSAPGGGRVGIVSGTFTQGANGAPKKPLANIMSYNSIAGLMELSGLTFAHFGPNSCSGTYAIATMKNNDDGIHPIQISGSTLEDVDEDHQIIYHRPNVGKINSADCVDMDCDGLKKALFKDLDGTFLGAPGHVIPQSEYEWNGDSRRGLGDYRIPKEMVTRLDGSRIPYDTLAPNKGIYRGDNCTYMSAWNSYRCYSDDYELLILENMDSDTETRRVSPVAVLANGYIDLINGPQDHGWCSGYTCRKRLSTFMAVVATGLDYLVHFTGTTPQHMRYYLLNSQPDEAIKLTVWYARPNRLDIFVEDNFVIATNARIDSNGNYIISKPKGDEYRPMVLNATGTNFMDIDSGLLSIIIKGPQRIDVRTQEVILVSFGLPAMTEADFFGENIIENLAAFLNIPLTKVRVVDIVSASSSGRRRRSATGISVTIELGDEPASTLNSTVSNSINHVELLSLASYIVNECQAGNISESFNVSGSCESIEVPVTSASENQTVYTAETVVQLMFTQDIVVQYEGVPLSVQPKVQAQDPFGNTISSLGTIERPWQLTASLRQGTGHPNAVLDGTLTVNSSQGWCNFTDLTISHMGTGYILDFNFTYPDVAENVTLETAAFDVPGRPIKGNVVTMTTGDVIRNNPFTVTLDLRDENTDEIISDISWRSHTWHVTASLVGTPAYGSLTGTTTTTFDSTSGQAFFPDLAISGLGVYYVQFQVTTAPAGFNFTVYQKVLVIDPSHVAMTVEEQNEIQVKFDVDFNKVLQTPAHQYEFEQLVLGRYANEWSQVRMNSGSLSEGSIVVTFIIDGSVGDVNATAYSLCESIVNSTDYVFNGYTLTLAPYMTINGSAFYGVSCGSIESSSDDSLHPGIIVAIVIGVLLLLVLIVAVVVWRVKFQPKSKTHSLPKVNPDADNVVNTKFEPNFLFREDTMDQMKRNLKNSSPLPPIATGIKHKPYPRGFDKPKVLQSPQHHNDLPPLKAPPTNLPFIFPGYGNHGTSSGAMPTTDEQDLRQPSPVSIGTTKLVVPQGETPPDCHSVSSRASSPGPYLRSHSPFNERDSPMPPVGTQLYDGAYIKAPSPSPAPYLPTPSPEPPRKTMPQK